MQVIKLYIAIVSFLFTVPNGFAQNVSLDSILLKIKANNPQLKMYDADILSMNVAASGAKSWMPPQVSGGFFMTPYNPKMWTSNDMNAGMGSLMVGFTQMIPNQSKLKAEFDYMSAMSSVETENKNYTLNQLYALAKSNYYQWIIIDKKINVLKENLALMDYMVKSMEIRYQYNMDKLPNYYKAKSQYSSFENMIVMLENDLAQKRIMLNTLMAEDKSLVFAIDTSYNLLDTRNLQYDIDLLKENRSDLHAIDNTINLNNLKIELEKKKLLPEFGIKYDHMIPHGNNPRQFNLMGMMIVPMPWSTKMNKANIESFKIKNESLNFQKDMTLNEATGMLESMKVEFENVKRQLDITNNYIIPSLKNNYSTALIGWQNNTGDLFIVLDAIEALNMAQNDSLDKLKMLLTIQVEIEKQLEIK